MGTVLEPPDGGYGWVIVFASILNNFLMVPLIQNVVLIFKDKMLEIDMTITQMWFTLNVHASFGYITHLINNLLLKQFGYRKVTLAGVSFVFFGLSMSSWIHNYLGFMLTFGIVTGIGVGLNTSCYTLAIKSYFNRNQNNAIALSMTLTALGPILMPQIINILIQHYDPDGVILILAGIIAHGYIGAVLLQPVKMHMVKISNNIEMIELGRKSPLNNDGDECSENETVAELIPQQFQLAPREFITNRRFSGFRRKDSAISVSYEQEHAAIMGLDSTLGGSLYSVENGPRKNSTTAICQQKNLTKTTWWKSEESINLGSCYNIFEDSFKRVENNDVKIEKNINDKKNKTKPEGTHHHHNNGVTLDEKFHLEEHKINYLNYCDIKTLPRGKRWFYQCVELFGLDIFLDLRYVNIMIGMSLAILVEMNFTVLLPFLLFEYSLNISEVAAFLSVLGAADILFRFLAPHVGDFFKQPARIMIILVLAVIIGIRTALIYVTTYPLIIIIALVLGCFKGLRVVYMSLIIPSYVPEERLASASAIQIISNSIMALLGGYAMGITRTRAGSYIYCVILLNTLTALTILMWFADILFKKYNKKRITTNIELNGDNLKTRQVY